MRIGINVPNELVQRVKQANPDVNVSQICREALENYARQSERIAVQVAEDGVEGRLDNYMDLEHFPLVEPDWEGFAFEDAQDWLNKATPADWCEFLCHREWLRARGREDETWFADTHGMDGVKRFWDRRKENEDWILSRYEMDESFSLNEIRSRYERTWIAYLEEVRRLWEQYRQAKHQEMMAERQKNWQALRKPELPPQLQD